MWKQRSATINTLKTTQHFQTLDRSVNVVYLMCFRALIQQCRRS